MPLTDEIIRILDERATQRINFNYGRVRLNAEAFRFVESAIRQGRVSVVVGGAGLETGASAYYDRDAIIPTLHLWNGATPEQIRGSAENKSVIVHECVHIYIHLRFRERVRLLEDEVTAFLAQTIYRLALQGYVTRGATVRGGSFSTEVRQHAHTQSGGVFGAAQQIVLDHRMLDRHDCTPLTESDVEPLKRALQGHALYS